MEEVKKHKNVKTEGVSVRWQLPHVHICCSPSEHFSLHVMARAAGAQWEGGREGEKEREGPSDSQKGWWWQAVLPSFFFISLCFVFFSPPWSRFFSVSLCLLLPPPSDTSGHPNVPRGPQCWCGPPWALLSSFTFIHWHKSERQQLLWYKFSFPNLA